MDLRVGGKFKLIKKCGSGAFGEIYQGKYHICSATGASRRRGPIHPGTETDRLLFFYRYKCQDWR